MKKHYDVIIIGGGVSGSSTAYFLSSQSDFNGSVLVIERDPTYAGAPSARATGGIRQQFSTPENIQIGLFGAQFAKNIDAYLAVDDETTGVIFREQGYLLLATEQVLPIMQQNHTLQRELGADIVFKDPVAITQDFPWLKTTGLAGGFFGASNEGWVDPYGLLQSYRRKARSLGVDYVQDEALDVIRDGSRVTGVRLRDNGVIDAGAVVNTAGASGAAAIAQSIGIQLPIESRKRCAFVFECRDDLATAPLTVLPNAVAWRPEGSRFIVNVAPQPENDPVSYGFDIDYELFEATIWPSLAEWIPAFEAIKLTQAYCCHYDFNTLDENLIIGLCPGIDNFYLAIGFSGHGMQQSPAVGRALYELITFGEYRSIDLSRFGYQRVLTGQGIHENNCW